MSAQSNDVINLDNNGDGNGYFVFICTEISLLEICFQITQLCILFCHVPLNPTLFKFNTFHLSILLLFILSSLH